MVQRAGTGSRGKVGFAKIPIAGASNRKDHNARQRDREQERQIIKDSKAHCSLSSVLQRRRAAGTLAESGVRGQKPCRES